MGTVYRARDIVLDRDVALKVLHTGANLNAELRERFNREARAGAKLQHPSIVIVYDMGEAAGASYIAMELLRGADLRAYIHEARPLSLAQKLEFIAQICDGLAHAHRHGIVHRDIKPSNIFIQEEKQAKLLDFSIARLPSSKLTIVGRVLGSPNYMAPEQILSRPCDTRSDLFSAAIVFFEFLVNSHPFKSSFIPRRIAEKDPDSLCELDPLIPESLDLLLAAGLRRNPDERIQTAEEFAIRLRAVTQELRTGLATPMSLDVTPRVQETPDGSTGERAPLSEDDSAQWRVLEFIRMLREFDEALALSNIDIAQNKMDEMRQMVAADGRFSGAVQEYQKRLDAALAGSESVRPRAMAAGGGTAVEREQDLPVVPSTSATDDLDDTQRFFGRQVEPANSGSPASPSAPVTPAPADLEGKACRFCGGRNRDSARYCRECGEDLMLPSGSVPDEVRPAPPVGSPNFLARLSASARALSSRGRDKVSSGVSALDRTTKRLWSLLLDLSPTQKLIGAAGAVAVLLVAAAAVSLRPARPVPVEKAVGVAVVEVPVAYLLENPIDTGKRLMPLQKGTRVNVLEQLKAADQPFVHAQFVSPKKNSRPGYVRIGDLGQWDSDDAGTEWNFVRTFEPKDGATEDQQRRLIDELLKFSSRFPGTPQAAEANLQRAGLHLEFVRRRKSAGSPESDWQADVTKAKEAVDGAAGDASAAADVGKLRQELEALTPPPEPPPQPPPVSRAAVDPRLQDLLNKAAAAWNAGEEDNCQEYAKSALILDPKNRTARGYLYQVEEARKLRRGGK